MAESTATRVFANGFVPLTVTFIPFPTAVLAVNRSRWILWSLHGYRESRPAEPGAQRA